MQFKATRACIVLLARVLCACVISYPSLAEKQAKGEGSQVQCGEYLVRLGGCSDCHSPKVPAPVSLDILLK